MTIAIATIGTKSTITTVTITESTVKRGTGINDTGINDNLMSKRIVPLSGEDFSRFSQTLYGLTFSTELVSQGQVIKLS